MDQEDQNQDIENEEDDDELEVDVDNLELDDSDNELIEEIYAEIKEAVYKNAENLKLLKISFENLKLEVFEEERISYQKIFKQIEAVNALIEEVEAELAALSA